jgi:hypothetical protein
MAKTLRTSAELEALINAELRQYEVCEGISVSIQQITDKRVEFSWDAHAIRGSGTPLLPECKEVIRKVVRQLQDKYDLAPED